MAVPSTTLAIRYTGNGSAVTPYSIPFPFLDTDHIFAAVSSDGAEDPVALSSSEFEVTRLADGSGGSLVTAAAVTDPAAIVIWRSVSLTQPTVLQTAGPLPAKSIETALDRLLMQVQQLNRRLNIVEGVADDDFVAVPTGNPDEVREVPNWLDATARALVAPLRAGQLGVQRDNQTIWIGQSTDAGDWSEFMPKRAGKLVLGLVADAGDPGSEQDDAAALLADWDVDAVLFAGNTNLSGPTEDDYADDWAAFASFISDAVAYPALGRKDLDNPDWESLLADTFPYLPGNGRYYSKVLGNGLVEIFVINSGFDSLRDLQEPDGNEVGSTQHAWFVGALAASSARWKIAVFSMPPVTLDGGEGVTAVELAWPELSGVDLICCGNSHMLELIKWNDRMLANLSAVTQDDGQAEGVLQGAGISTAWPLWADDTSTGLGRIVATDDSLRVEVWNTDGEILHARSVTDLAPLPVIQETFRQFGVETYGGDAAGFMGNIGSSVRVLRGRLSVTTYLNSSDVPVDFVWTLRAGPTVLATGTLPAGDTAINFACDVPGEMIPAGARLTIVGNMDYATDLVLTLFTQPLN